MATTESLIQHEQLTHEPDWRVMEDGPMLEPEQESGSGMIAVAVADGDRRAGFPSKDEQVFRIIGTTGGMGLFAGALAESFGANVLTSIIAGGTLGLAISGYAAFLASRALSRKA